MVPQTFVITTARPRSPRAVAVFKGLKLGAFVPVNDDLDAEVVTSLCISAKRMLTVRSTIHTQRTQRMAQAQTYEAFFAQPFEPGRWWWTQLGVSLLLQWGRERGEHIMLYMMRQPDNWSAPGEVSGWDGDLERPTLHPSISVPGEWHGYLRDGEMEDA